MKPGDMRLLRDVLFFAPLCFRLEEQGKNRWNPVNMPDLVQGQWAEPVGQKRLTDVVEGFFKSRGFDRTGWTSPKSLFLNDVAALMTHLEHPEWIFHGPAKFTMLQTVSRLLYVAGWQTMAGHTWRDLIEEIDPGSRAQERVKSYRRSLRSYWVWRDWPVRVRDVFEDEIRWAIERKLSKYAGLAP